MIGKYKLAYIGGIARGHEKQFRACETALTLDGYICFAPVVYDMEVYKQHPDLLDDMCYEKLLICDLFVIATPEHIGRSTTHRLCQCFDMGIPTYIWVDDHIEEFTREDFFKYRMENWFE